MMRTRKNKFLTFIFSILPGAGHMYLGLMKMGLCYMSLFLGICFLGSWLNIGPSLFVAAIIWFYAFFDCLNIMAMDDESYFALQDRFLWDFDNYLSDASFINKKQFRMSAAIGCIVIGLMILWQNFSSCIIIIFPKKYRLLDLMYYLNNTLPQWVFSIFIIFIGIKLILGKKKELKKEEFDES